MHFYVYILYSRTKDRFYVGYSQNPDERVFEHNLGATRSTRSGRPWVLVYRKECKDKTEAIKEERRIKKMKSRRYIEKLVSSSFLSNGSSASGNHDATSVVIPGLATLNNRQLQNYKVAAFFSLYTQVYTQD